MRAAKPSAGNPVEPVEPDLALHQRLPKPSPGHCNRAPAALSHRFPHPPLAEAAVPAREGANTTVSKPWELDIGVNPRICIQKNEVYP